jgi:isoleucyl-tRNA synthetase
MVFARTFVTFGLTQRSAAGIKVRQPLTSLRIKHDAPAIPFWDNFAEIIKEELNVKEVILEKGDGSDEPGVVLDTHLTPALVREGYIRDLIRAVQELRKEADLKPSDKVTLSVQTGDSEDMKALVEEARSELSQSA